MQCSRLRQSADLLIFSFNQSQTRQQYGKTMNMICLRFLLKYEAEM